MKYYELDQLEQELLQQYDVGVFKSVPGFGRQKTVYQKYAQATMAKTKNVNIRIPEKDLLKLKSLAAQKGIPYQTLLASLIHQYSAGQIKTHFA